MKRLKIWKAKITNLKFCGSDFVKVFLKVKTHAKLVSERTSIFVLKQDFFSKLHAQSKIEYNWKKVKITLKLFKSIYVMQFFKLIQFISNRRRTFFSSYMNFAKYQIQLKRY